MNKNQLKLLIAVLLLLMPFSAFGFLGAGASDTSVGQLMVKSDQVYVLRDGQKIPINNFGMLLQTGDIVQTDDSGKAQIETTAGDKIFIGPSTKLNVSTQLSQEKKGVKKFFMSVWGKIRAQVKKSDSKRVIVKTPSATVGVKGTDFVVEYNEKTTRVGTLEGLVNLTSEVTRQSLDIPQNTMTSVSPSGEVLPLSEFAGEMLKGLEFAGEQADEEDFSGGKVDM